MPYVYPMELSILIGLHAVAIIGLYISYQRRETADDFLMVMFAGLCFITLGIGLLNVEYKIPNGSISGYTQIFENSNPENIGLMLLYSLFGISYIYNNYTLYKGVTS
jgi:succinate dehydrogenase hydrophobic anchor subunit